jgi:hypothetical protein
MRIYRHLVNFVGFAVSSGIDVRVVKLRACIERSCVMFWHSITGLEELRKAVENLILAACITIFPVRILEWEARVLTSKRRYSVFKHI